MTVTNMHSSSGVVEMRPIPIDFRRLELIASTVEEKQSLFDIFFETARESIAEMRSALRSQNLTDWKEAAHKLRGAASNMGMTVMARLCLESENIDWNDPDAYGLSIKGIEDETARIKAYVSGTSFPPT